MNILNFLMDKCDCCGFKRTWSERNFVVENLFIDGTYSLTHYCRSCWGSQGLDNVGLCEEIRERQEASR